ncbi:hypothetical protein ACLBOM_25370 [Escherichia coli]
MDDGRGNYGVAYDIGAWTDVLPEFGAIPNPKDVFMTGCTTWRLYLSATHFFLALSMV